jgi:hypothetical protein
MVVCQDRFDAASMVGEIEIKRLAGHSIAV